MPLDAIENPTIREHLAHNQFVKVGYLNWHGFIIRALVYFAIWNLLSYLLSRWSREQNSPPLRDNSTRFKVISGPGIILYAFTISFAAIDWVMSLDPSWISTIYGLLFVAGELISALCFAVVIEANFVQVQAHVSAAAAGFRARPRQVHADVRNGVGILLVFCSG